MAFIRQLKQELADAILADAAFALVPVLAKRRKELTSELQEAIGPSASNGGKGGAFVTVEVMEADAQWQNVVGPFYNRVTAKAFCFEFPTINNDPNVGIGFHAEDMAERIATLWGLQFKPANANSPMRPATPTLKLEVNDNFVIWSVTCETSGGSLTLLNQIATPVIVNTLGTITITCITPGAAIFYTTDGRYPNPKQTLYAGSFVPGAVTVRARAWLAGFLASEMVEMQL